MRFWDASAIVPLLVGEERRPSTLDVVTLDDRLADAARKEGFRVLPAQA